MGFCVPVGDWFRGRLHGLLLDALLSSRSLARGYFEPRALNDLVTSHVKGHADHTGRLWSLLMLELWHREMVDGAPTVSHASHLTKQ
jgi:asparagine synthase (glutamine-hydrolysing)